ncbi:winged helix-turn-helix domain-containing protein [Micromonospora rubida]|uniref:winged helix-turn-helix domain-containing protein n=1 Tax=Micromonospora rubida TaxID=2697657 RepID=UPI001378FEE8|nr:winged helix-turn-helix domain-containing protein [Micromonospora rubida]NBE79882.1 GntR family transcriptional regulator [Micromonospora rubida]
MTAKYERVAEAIREQIRAGKLAVGDKLPSTSALRTQHRVSYGSIRGAMLVLKAEGLVDARSQRRSATTAPRTCATLLSPSLGEVCRRGRSQTT